MESLDKLLRTDESLTKIQSFFFKGPTPTYIEVHEIVWPVLPSDKPRFLAEPKSLAGKKRQDYSASGYTLDEALSACITKIQKGAV